MIKLHNILFSAVVAFVFCSCSDWLDVQPTTEKDRDDLTQTADGYKQMLYGTYINLTTSALYGNNLSYGFLEVLARNYCDISLASGGNYSYTDKAIRGYCDDIWEKMYNNIANVNSILKDVSSRQSLFVPVEYRLLAGEAYAMRAFMHFDLLRMYAPRYVGNEDVTAIPYVDAYERVRFPHLTAREVMKKVLADLDTADSLLDVSDPLQEQLQTITYNGNGDFTANRQYRFNYWACQALRARACMYMGDTAGALKYALRVINDGPFKWVSEKDVSAGDRVFQSEMILGLDVPDLPDYYDSNFGNSKYTLGSQGWSGIISWGESVFEDVNDYRFLYLFGNDKNNNKIIPQKYLQEIGSGHVMQKQTVPLIRLGEMYLIAAECQLESNLPEALRLVRELKLHRGYFAEGQGIADNVTADGLREIIRKEFRKETYAEGQMWFYYKRIDSKTTPNYSTWNPDFAMETSNYTFPLPEQEKEYGNIPTNSTPAGNE